MNRIYNSVKMIIGENYSMSQWESHLNEEMKRKNRRKIEKIIKGKLNREKMVKYG